MSPQKLILVLVTSFLAGAVGTEVTRSLLRQEAQNPARPTGVPAEAVWSGGPDGGAWFQCAALNDDEFNCTVFADTTGDVVERGHYRLQSHSAIGETLRPQLLVAEGIIEVHAWLVRSE
jgi:hypothetical protein